MAFGIWQPASLLRASQNRAKACCVVNRRPPRTKVSSLMPPTPRWTQRQQVLTSTDSALASSVKERRSSLSSATNDAPHNEWLCDALRISASYGASGLDLGLF